MAGVSSFGANSSVGAGGVCRAKVSDQLFVCGGEGGEGVVKIILLKVRNKQIF